jgi:hypothetical protein
MSNTKCPRCGLNNWSSDEACERCGLPLAGGEPEVREPEEGATEVRAAEFRESEARESEAARPDFPTLTFGSDVQSGSRTLKLILVVVFAVALCGAGWAFYKLRGGMAGAMRRDLVPRSLDERTRDTVLSYLAQPGFAGERVAEQVLGPARLEILQLPDREVYFSVPPPDQTGQTFEAIVARFVIDRQRVVLAEDDGTGRLRLGKYSLRRSANKDVFFKTPVDNVKFDPEMVLEFHFRPAVYKLDMRELNDFVQNRSIFGGRMLARTAQRRSGLPVVFANHGAFVARPEETSLRRFVGELTRDLPADGEGARESRVQRVLDFVSHEITYDLREATYNFEMLKRPNEVLMTGQSDCSNKAILLGSLLEQLGEDYLFVYTPDHITVAVGQGRFPARNGLSLEWEGQTWLIAEGTVPGFRIGLDRVQEEARLKQFQHVQRPRDRDLIFDLATGHQLLFQ